MIDYAYSKGRCREKILLEYFGETDAKDCGCCDVCRDHKKNNDTKRGVKIIEKVSAYLKAHPDGADLRIMERDLQIPAGELGEYIEFLCSEGFAEVQDGLIRLSER